MKMVKKKRFWLILMGEEWTGKSSAGNTMLGQTVFKVDRDTEHVMQSFGVIEGRDVTMVDTPGWNSECSPDVPLKMLKKAHNSAMGQGFHILLLTIPISQNQEWNQKVARRLSNALALFNDDTWKHTMILFTRADLLHSTGLEGYLKGSGQPFQILVEKCQRRYHVLNNHKRNDHQQVRELMEKVEQMVQENNGQSLQLVMSEQEVSTLREHEMNSLRDNRQLVERCSKMEEHIGRESGFRLEDLIFKSLPPEENHPPMTHPTEQSELPEENCTCVLRSKSEMSHPGDMKDVALEYIHTQDEDTASTLDLCTESPAEIIRHLAMSSDDGGDKELINVEQTERNTCTEVEETGLNRNPGHEEKDKKHLQYSPLQRNSPQTWDNQWDLDITCYIYSEESVVMTCVLQVSVCWRKMKPSCQRDWISFTVCSDNVIWIYIMVLYLFVRYLCLIYEAYGVSRETGNQNMSTLISGFVERQEKPIKENQGAFQSLLLQISNNRPEEITQCNNMEDDEGISQHSTGGKDEKMKKGEDEELPQHSQKGDDEELPQHSQKGDDEELPQHRQKGDDEELPQHRQKGDDEELPQHRQKGDDEELPQHSQKGDDEEEDDNDEEEQSEQIIEANDEITHQSKRGDNKEMSQNDGNEKGENILQHRKRVDDDHVLQHIVKEDVKQVLQNNKTDYEETNKQSNAHEDEELIKLKRTDDNLCRNSSRHGRMKKIHRKTKRVEYENTTEHSQRGHKEEMLQHSSREDYEEIPQQSKRCKDEELSKHVIKDMEEIRQNHRRGYKKEIPQNNTRGYEEAIPQKNRRGYEEAIPQSNRRGYEEEIPQSNRRGYEEEIPQSNRNDEEIAKHSRKTCNEETQLHQRKGNNGDQQWKSAHDHEMSGLEDSLEIHEQCRKRANYEIPQHRRKRIEKDLPQHTSVWDTEEIKEAPEQQVEGIVEIRGANKKIHHNWCRHQHTTDVNNFAGAREEDTRQQGGLRKRRRNKSLERFTEFYRKEEKTAVNKTTPTILSA